MKACWHLNIPSYQCAPTVPALLHTRWLLHDWLCTWDPIAILLPCAHQNSLHDTSLTQLAVGLVGEQPESFFRSYYHVFPHLDLSMLRSLQLKLYYFDPYYILQLNPYYLLQLSPYVDLLLLN